MRGSVQRIPLTDLEVPLVPGTPGKPSTDGMYALVLRAPGRMGNRPSAFLRRPRQAHLDWLATVFTEPNVSARDPGRTACAVGNLRWPIRTRASFVSTDIDVCVL